MAYNMKIGTKVTKDTYYTMAPVNWLLRIFVKSNVKKYKNEVVKCWNFTETLIVLSALCTINAFFLFHKIQRLHSEPNKELKFSDIIQLLFIIGFMQYLFDLIFVFRVREKCVAYIKLYAQIDKILTVPNFSEMRMKNLVAIALFVIGFVTSSVLDYFAWFAIFGWVVSMLYSLDYVYIFINALTAYDMMANVIQIEYRVKVMVDIIEEYASMVPSTEGLALNEDLSKNRHVVENNEAADIRRVDTLKTVSYGKHIEIFSLRKYYLLLMEQVDYINMAYGFRLAAFCVTNLVYMTHLTNIILRIIMRQLIQVNTILPALSSSVRLLNYCSVVIMLVYRCGETYRQCARVVQSIDLAVVTKDIPPVLKASLLDLRALLLSRPVQFHGAEFFTMNYPLLVSLSSVVITHSIILLQNMQ